MEEYEHETYDHAKNMALRLRPSGNLLSKSLDIV